MPRWRDAAAAISKLSIGLDDAEFVGEVPWFGLTSGGAEGNPAEQERAIVDRLVRRDRSHNPLGAGRVPARPVAGTSRRVLAASALAVAAESAT